MTPKGLWRTGNGGNSSWAELAVEYACLERMAHLASDPEESTDRSMTDHVVFAPSPYKEAETKQPNASLSSPYHHHPPLL